MSDSHDADRDEAPPGTPIDETAHQALRELVGAHALGLLDPTESAEVRDHLRGCADCRTELAELSGLGALLQQVDLARVEAPDPVPELTPALEAAINARLTADTAPAQWSEPAAAPDEAPDARVIPLRRRRRLLAAASGAAAGLVLVGGVGGYLLSPKPPPKGPFEPVPVVVAQAGTEATAGVIPHTWGVEIRMTATGFTSGEHYVVKVVDDSGALRDAGEFVGTGANTMVCNLNSSVLRADAAGFVVFDDEDREVVTSQF